MTERSQENSEVQERLLDLVEYVEHMARLSEKAENAGAIIPH